MMNKLEVLSLYVATALAQAMPPILIKKYINTNDFNLIIFSVLSYLFLIYFYSIILRNSNLSIAYPLLKVFSVLIIVVSSILYFKEDLSSTHLIGIIFGIIAIILLSAV